MTRQAPKRNGDYPEKLQGESETQEVIRLGSLSLLLTKRESTRAVSLFLGGPLKWCIYCELPKDASGAIKETGYLNKVRFDVLCSMEHSFAKGQDTKQLIRLLSQILSERYSTVKMLSFNDTSTKACDNRTDVSLAFMTFLYLEQTWYEKNFGAIVAPQSVNAVEALKRSFQELKEQPWETFWEYAYKGAPLSESVLKGMYERASSWKEFYEPIVDQIGIAEFCTWISHWSARYMLDNNIHFSTFTYWLPVRSYGLTLQKADLRRDSRRRRRNYTRKH